MKLFTIRFTFTKGVPHEVDIAEYDKYCALTKAIGRLSEEQREHIAIINCVREELVK